MINNSSTLSSWGNNFNNGDEALFQDSPRPRDSYGFKIKPGQQSGKWDWKDSNSNIKLEQIILKGAKKSPQASTITYDYAYLKKEYTASDFSSLIGYVMYGDQTIDSTFIDKLVKDRKAEIMGSPSVIVKDGNAVIQTSGTYIIQAYCDFIFPNGYNTSNSYKWKEYVGLLVKEKESDNFDAGVRTQGRACGSVDGQTATYVGWLKAGTILNTGFLHTYSSDVLCDPSLNIYRLN